MSEHNNSTSPKESKSEPGGRRTEAQIRESNQMILEAIEKKRDLSPITRNLVNQKIQLERPGRLRLSGNRLCKWRPPGPDREAIKEIERALLHRFHTRFERAEKNTDSKTRKAQQVASTSREIGASRQPILDPKETNGYDEANFLRLCFIVERSENKSKMAPINIKQLQDRFVMDLEKLIAETRKDELLQKIIKAVERKDSSSLPPEYYYIRNQLSTRFGLLLKDDRVVIPKSLQFTVLQLLHTGHIGYSKMLAEARCFWWREMEYEIEEKAKRCKPCIAAGKNLKTQLPLTEKNKLEELTKPGEELQLDFSGNLPEYGNIYLLVSIDRFSKWPMAKICQNTGAETAIKFMEQYITINGVPKTIRCDNASAFTGNQFDNYCKSKGIKFIPGLPNLHTATGMVERTIQTLKNYIRTNREDGKSITDSVQLALRSMRMTIHTRLGKTPFELHFGREPRKEIHNLLGSTKESIHWLKSMNVSANPNTLYAYAVYNNNGEPTDHLTISKKKITATTRRTKSPVSPLTPVSKLPYFCYEKAVHPKTTESKFKREPLKIISETNHTVLTDTGRRLHKKLVSKPFYFQPNQSNRGKGPRDPVTQKFIKKDCQSTPRITTENIEAVTDGSPKETEIVDLTQSSSGSSKTNSNINNRDTGQTQNNHCTDNTDTSRPKRKIVPVVKYGAIHYR